PLLHLFQPELAFAPLGDVPCDLGKADQLAVFTDRIDNDAGPEEGAVLADAPAFFLIATVLLGDRERARRLAVGAIGLGIEARKMLAENFRWVIALDALPADIPAGHHPDGVEHVQRIVGDILHQQAETALALKQIPFLFAWLIHRPRTDRMKRSKARFVPRNVSPGKAGFRRGKDRDPLRTRRRRRPGARYRHPPWIRGDRGRRGSSPRSGDRPRRRARWRRNEKGQAPH